MQDNERKPWQKGGSAAKAIGAYVANMLDPIARARGFAITSLLSEWPAVVGEELARFTAPEKVVWPRRSEDGEAASPQSAWRTDGAILVLKVDGPRAIEVQHRAEQILERVNIYFGYRAIAQLRFLQAPVPKAKSQAPSAGARKRRGALLCRRRCRYRARQGPWTACSRYPRQDPGTLRRASAFLASAIKNWPENGKPPESKRAE